MKWNYISNIKKSTGYENCINIKKYTHKYYENATNEKKDKIIDDVFNYYRNYNIFPINYYSEDVSKVDKYKNVKFENIYIRLNKDLEWVNVY